MLPDTPGFNFSVDIYREYYQTLIREGIMEAQTCLIDETKFNTSVYATMPEYTQSMIDRFVDLADKDPEKLAIDLESSLNTHRFFRVRNKRGNRYAKICFQIAGLRAILLHPQDDALLGAVFNLGRCTHLDANGNRCRRRIRGFRLCRIHIQTILPALPPAAE